MHLSVSVGIVCLLLSLGLRRATINRHIKGRLLLSSVLFAAYILAAVAIDWFPLTPDALEQLRAVAPLLVIFGIINFTVALAINSWHTDRLPDRFPNIVQDSIVIALFAIAATLLLRERVFTTTAVGAVVIGFALQDTLGNLFSGLAIQIEKPFSVGDWVMIGGQDGMVSEITWRATKMRTKAGNFLVVPNSVLAKDTIVNYSQPTRSVQLQVDVGASYDVAPNQVKSVIREALRDAGELSPGREVEVLLVDFAPSSMTYRVRFWISDFEADERAKDHVRALIYYAFRRSRITIPYPVQIEMSPGEGGLDQPAAAADGRSLGAVAFFEQLSEPERTELWNVARPVLFAAGETIVRQGAAGQSLFVIAKGEAAVRLADTAGDVAVLRTADLFGEMSLLTGEPRTATVIARSDCELLEIDAEGFRRVLQANPGVLERVTTATAVRRQELERHRGTHAVTAPAAEARATLIDRVREFLRL